MSEHREGHVMIGGLVPPHYKAITIVTVSAIRAKGVEMDQLKLIWTGVSRIAEQLGILDSDGNVTPEWRDVVDMTEQEIRSANRANRGQPGHRPGKVEVKAGKRKGGTK